MREALELLRRAGFDVVYSSTLVTDSLTVRGDPGPGSLQQRAERLLAEHQLELVTIRPGRFAVVRQRMATPAETDEAATAIPPQGIEEVAVFASRYRIAAFDDLAPSSLTRQQVEALPGIDEDALRVTRYLPGTATNGLSARANVRGGRDNELAVYFDDVPLYEPFHYKDFQALLGVLDPSAVSRLDFYSGVFPAEFGDRLSGVLDISPRMPTAGLAEHELGVSLLYAHALSVGERKVRDRPVRWLASVRQSTAELAIRAAERSGIVDVEQIEDVVARIARIPAKTVSMSDKEVLRNLERNLKLVIFGQDPAIEALAAAIKMARSGLGEQRKPVGSFLFAGPTGVGKTEVTRQLATSLGVEFLRFDMSEYMERHTVSRLIGAPPGYVGFDQGGLLTEAVAKNPHCVLLLDEIEKAHPDVFNLLLQVMDHGTLTDNNGRKADFRNTVLIMTTNAGAEMLSRRSIGFTEQDNSSDGLEAVKKVFTPEFRNRLDGIIQFGALSPEVVRSVVRKFLAELEAQVAERKVRIEIDEAAQDWLVAKGYDEKMGARPMARVIQEYIKKPLAEILLFGELEHRPGVVHVVLDGDHLVLQVESP